MEISLSELLQLQTYEGKDFAKLRLNLKHKFSSRNILCSLEQIVLIRDGLFHYSNYAITIQIYRYATKKTTNKNTNRNI